MPSSIVEGSALRTAGEAAPPRRGQIVTLSFFHFPMRHMRWAMAQMYLVRKQIRRLSGVQFFKPVGTAGGGGYGVLPDLRTYALLIVWESPEAAAAWPSSSVFAAFRRRSREAYTLTMRPILSKGSWSDFSAWECEAGETGTDLVCVLTRATIRPLYLRRFWRQVGRVARAHENAEGVVFTRGLAEVPLLEQATFSVWRDRECMEAFAYEGAHARSIQETRRREGFREEMFTRFEPLATTGTWGGEDPVGELLAAAAAV